MFTLRRPSAALLIGLAAFAAAPTAYARKCGEAIHPKRQETRVIALQDDISGPAFYARFDRYVLYLSSDLVISVQEKLSGRANDSLLEALRRELPLKQDFDLFSLAVNRTTGVLQLKDLLANALDSGRGRFRDMYRDSQPRVPEDNQIIRVSVSLGKTPVEAREFCNRSGDLLFFVVDGIEN